MSRVSDLTCDETMPSVDEVERRDGRRFFQQSVGVPIARIAPVMPSVSLQQNSRQFVKTYIRSQANAPPPAGCSNSGQKMVHTYGTAAISSAPQCATTVPGRSKLVTIRPVGPAHSFFKSYDITQLSGSPMTTVYLQQQHNLHLPSAQQPILSLSSSRARELEDSRVIRSSATAFANCGSIDSRRYLTSGRNIVGVSDIPVRSSVRVNPIISSADFLRGTKVVTRISDEKTDVKPVMLPAPTINMTFPASATSIASLHDTCIPVPAGQHDGIAGTSYPGPSARPTILRKNRESGSVSAVRRLIVAEAHPHTGPYQEVLTSPLAAVRDNSGQRTSATDSRILGSATCISSDARGIFARKTPAILIGNVVQNTKNFSDQVAVTGAVEVSPRKRLRKQNFECTNTEKMKLLISAERVVGDSFVTVKDELTWKSADFDCEARDDPVPEKVPRRRSRVRIDNGTGMESLQQRVSTSVPHQVNSDNYTKVKRMKKTQMIQRNKLSASGVPAVVELDSNSWSVNSFVDEKRTLQYGRMEYINAETTEAQINEKWIEEAEVQKIEDITYLMCHIFGLKLVVPDDPYPNSRRFLHKSCDLSATFCFFGEGKINGNSPSRVLDDEILSHFAYNKQTMMAKEPVGSTVPKSAVTAESMSNMQDDSRTNEVQYGQFTEQNRKVFAQMLLCSGLKDRWQRFDRISGCERVIKRIYVKRWMLQEHFRNTKQSVTADVELNSNLVASLEDYSLMAAKKQAEKFLESYPTCSPSTSDNVFEKNVDSGSVYVYKYLEEALEVYTRSVSSNLIGPDHISPQRSIQTGVRLSCGLHPFGYASRRDPETEMLQAVAEVLAEIIKIVIENDKEGPEERNEQQHLGRKRKKKDDHLFEIKIADRFGIFELPHTMPQASNNVVALYDSISQCTLSRKRKSEALDADDAFFMNIEKELNRKKKRVGGDKNLSRTLHSLSQVRAVYQRLSDMRKAERDNLNEATKQMLNLVRYSDPTSYVELINGYKEDCQPYDNDSVREGKWQNRLLSFTKAVPPKIVPASRNYDSNIAIKFHPPMNYTLRLFREKCIRPPKRFRSGMKRTRKSQSRRGRGRQRGSVVHSKKKSPTPEPQLEDLEPHFTDAEMGAMFKKEFGVDMRTFRYERCSQQELHSMCVDQEQPSHSREEQRLEATEVSIRSQPCTDCSMLKKNTAVDVGNGNALVTEVTAVISGYPEAIIENLKNKGASRGNGIGGSHVGSSATMPYLDPTQNDEISLLEHVQTRGRYIREHFATLLHALRISELLTVKAIKMFRDYAADLFDRENRDTS